MNETSPAKVPVTYWIVAGIAMLWNAFGGYDYLMTRTRNIEYLSQMGDAKVLLDWIDTFPLWAQIGWGLGVWASVAGSVLLLLRSRHATTAFLVSLIGAVISFFYQLISEVPAALDTTANKVMPLVILVVIAALWLYAKRCAEKGLLR